MTRFTISLLGLLGLLGLPLAAAAEEPPPFMKGLYPPDLIMRHARDVALSADQREAITEAVTATQKQTLELQWDMQEAARTLGELVGQQRVDEEAALEAATRVMEIEGRVKRAHLGLLIRIKNQLSPEQQEQLGRLRAQRP
jgi:Spy/CpxP family protein refolding chaperone